MAKIKYPLKAATFNQFKIRYLFFTTFFGMVFILLFFIRGNYFNLWQKLPFNNYYQILSIIFTIFYVIVSGFIYYIFKKNYSTKSD